MLNALYISALGMQAQKEQLDTSAANFANINTTAFKRQSVDFSAILDRPAAVRGSDLALAASPVVRRTLRTDMSAGEIHATGRPLDIAISGNGFLEVDLLNNKTGYSRSGSLQVNGDGGLSLSTGQALKADVRIPSGASNVRVLPDGSVTALLAGDSRPTTLGRIEIANFANTDSLQYRGESIFVATEGSDEATRSHPGEEGAGILVAQSLEGSNVGMVDEMVSLMLVQRVYELNSRVVQAADELMGMSNNLRRG